MNSLDLGSTLFSKILEATLSASILAAIVLLLQLALRRRLTAGWRFALWIPVLIRLLIPTLPESSLSIFNAPHWFRTFQPPPAPQITVEIKENVPLSTLSPPVTLQTGAAQHSSYNLPSIAEPTLFHKITLLWIAVSLFFFLRLGLGTLWLNFRLRKDRALPSPFLLRIFLSACQEARVSSKPRLIETNIVDSPGLFGFIRPILLLPRNIASQLTEIELRYIFLHELAHLKRGDLILNWLMSIAHALHWFNPFAWLLLRRMRLERELACDALVLQSTGSQGSRAYGETILKLLGRLKGTLPIPAMVGILEEKHTAKSRLKQIAMYKNETPYKKLGVLLLLCIAAVGLSNAQTRKTTEAPSPKNEEASRLTSRILDHPSAGGIALLEEEYAKQKKLVEDTQNIIDLLRVRLGVSDIAEENPSGNSLLEEQISRKDMDRIQAEAETVAMNARLQIFKGKTLDELRKIIPVAYPNAELDRQVSELHKTEQQIASMLPAYSRDHPKMKRLMEIQKTLNKQIDEQIQGVPMGLETRLAQSKTLAETFRAESESIKKEEAEKRATYQAYFMAKRNLENQQRIHDAIYLRLLAEKVDARVAEKTKSPAKIEIEYYCRLISLPINAATSTFIAQWFPQSEQNSSTPTAGSVTNIQPDFSTFTQGDALMNAAEALQGSQVLGGVSLLAFSGQTAVIKVAAGPKMEITGQYEPAEKKHTLRAEVSIPHPQDPMKFTPIAQPRARVLNGQTYVFTKNAHLPQTGQSSILSDPATLDPLFENTPTEKRTILFFIIPKPR